MRKYLKNIFLDEYAQFKLVPHIKLLREYFFFLDKIQILYNKLSKSGSFIEKIRLKLYIYFKYNLIRFKMFRIIKKDSTTLMKDPSRFVIVITSYFCFVLYYSIIMRFKFINDLIKSFNLNNNISINTDIDYIEDDQIRSNSLINKFKIINRSVESFKEFNDKFTITTTSIDLNYNTVEIEQTIYDCDNYFDSRTAKVLYNKYFQIDNNGKIINPNYIFDESLQKEELEDYKNMISHIIDLFTTLLIKCIQVENKKEEG